MSWEDPDARFIQSLIDAADACLESGSKGSAENKLQQALNNAERLGKTDYVDLIEDKLKELR